MGLTDYSRMDKEFFESGVRAEQERVIKLLQSDEAYGAFWLEYNSLVIKNTLDRLIALIEGEK